MSPDRDDLEPDTYEEEPPRSIFAATWFRAVLILIVLGVVGAVAVPYILDAVNPPAPQQAVVKSAPLPATPPAPFPPSPSAPAQPPAGATTATDPAPARALPPPSAPRSAPASATLPDATKPAAPAAKPSGAVAKADVPPAKPAPAAPKTDTGAKSSVSSGPAGANGSAAKKPAAPASAPAAKPAAKKAPEPRAAKATAPAAAGVYWVQVGAFKDEETAKRLAAKLREQNFKVADVTGGTPAPAASAAPPPPTASASGSATPAPAGPDQYDVFVTGLPPGELNTRLTAKGLAAEPSGTGVVIKPSLPLRDAVALSKDLAVEGYKVQVRRAGGAGATRAPARTPPPATAAAKPPAAGDGLYRVRVGSFTERAAALSALRELEAKGYKPFIARGER